MATTRGSSANAEGFERVGNVLKRVVSSREIRPGVDAQWIDPEEEQALTTDIATQLSALPTEIKDQDTYRRVVESLPLLKRAEDKVVSFFKEMKEAANRAHKAITTKESAQLKPIVDARSRMSRLKYGYEQEQDRIRRERERELQEIERKRREEEAMAQAAEVADTQPEMAEQIIEQAIAAPTPTVVLPSVTASVEVKGVGRSKPKYVWRFMGAPDHETGWKKLTPEQRQRVMSLIPRQYLMPDESAITAIVNGMSGNVQIPGIEIYDIGSTPVRG